MTGERSEASELFARQQAERAEFVGGLIKKLNDAGYDWNLSDRFKETSGYSGKGLLVPSLFHHEVLSPDEGLLIVHKGKPDRRVPLMGGRMGIDWTADYDTEISASQIQHLLESLEKAVNDELKRLNSPQI